MRTHKINIIINSNMDLESINSKRVKFTKLDKDTFKVESSLLFLKSEIHSFVGRYIKSRLVYNYIIGVCSAPSGYFI